MIALIKCPTIKTLSLTVNDSFQSYLMFRPSGAPYENIFVAIARVDWLWIATAQKQNGSWSIITDFCPPPRFHDEDKFPEWKFRFIN